ncbi:phosphoribulokinase [Actinomyces radicidentis]|uniref:Phosphoribulokinase n=1 Tax=Actinomyces radicidentis TaxID=111015 RepID=A0A0X8JEC4_ACTRD|nr:AAA family ATPase [Actinomyces radicidentis]AMD87071.1 phosphoribulokinase [Actinomyces radicidentis]
MTAFDNACTDLVDRLEARLAAPDAPARLVVGITGAPGSGKSTLAEGLTEALREKGLLAGTVPMDGFHMSNAVLDELGRHGRKGAPDTFDVAGYLAVLDRVRATGPDGEPAEVLAPVYRRDLHEPVAAGARVTGRGVVVTEGNYLALETHGWEGARERIDLLVMLDVPEEVLIRRLIARHKDFGRSPADAAHWVRSVDVPNARLVAATAERCDEVWELDGEEPAPHER